MIALYALLTVGKVQFTAEPAQLDNKKLIKCAVLLVALICLISIAKGKGRK